MWLVLLTVLALLGSFYMPAFAAVNATDVTLDKGDADLHLSSTSLVAHYKLDDESGTVAIDSANGQDATLSNMNSSNEIRRLAPQTRSGRRSSIGLGGVSKTFEVAQSGCGCNHQWQ